MNKKYQWQTRRYFLSLQMGTELRNKVNRSKLGGIRPIWSNKKSMSISIVFLVIFAIVLYVTATAYFVIKLVSNDKETLSVPNELDYIYLEENYLDFYLNQLFEISSKEIQPETTKAIFLSNLNKYLLDYDDYYIKKNLNQIKNQINENNVRFDKEKLVWNVSLLLSQENEKAGISVEYNYKRSFEKAFKVNNALNK